MDVISAPPAAAQDNATAPLAGVQRQLLGAHLLLLNRLLRRSARFDYEGFEPESQIERRIVLTLVRVDGGRVSELAMDMGHDVAQVSRALTTMRRTGLVARGRQREPYRLTERGRQLGAALDEVALRRDRQLTAGLGPQQMFELAGLLGNILHRARLIMREEFAKTRDAPREGDDDGEPGFIFVDTTPFEIHSRAQPLVINLAAMISRAATASFKRLTGVSSFEWRLLVNIAGRPALRFTDLVGHVDSDKAQVSRTLDALVCAGLVERTQAAAGEPVQLELTERGNRLHDVLREDSLRRNTELIADLNDVQRQRIQIYLELLIANASAMPTGPNDLGPA